MIDTMPATAAPVEDGSDRPEPLHVVGIGASAGGLKALQDFVGAIPSDSGLAFVVIVHLDPERSSRMGELLQDRTGVPVEQVTGTVPVEANRIYVIPPDGDLEIRDSMLVVRPRPERARHMPVDLFFSTLAGGCGPNAIGVILSGTGSDGTAGIRHIRERGGITVAQSPEEAEYEGMPASAIASGLIDLVLPAGAIPAELLRMLRLPSATHESTDAESEEELAKLFSVLRSRTGQDFSMYKRSSVRRRIARRLLFNGLETLGEYIPLVQSSPTESQSLMRDLLISLSSFFRDPEAFVALAESIPGLFEGKGPADMVRVWVVGCATGEEVYSIAMLLTEYSATLDAPPGIQMFATDLDERGYAWGREGLYPSSAVAGIGAERLRRFFTEEPGGYRITKSLRDLVLFAVHNVLQDPPFARMDLISCRNLLIYLQPEAQVQVLETFHYALNREGVLFLGSSESTHDRGLFRPIAGAHRIFARADTSSPSIPRLSRLDPLQPVAGRAFVGTESRNDTAHPAFSFGALHMGMVEQYAPPSVIVDERLNVVHLSAGAGRFLRMGEGEPSRRVLDLAGGDLRTALRMALRQAFDGGLPTTRQVRMEVGGTDTRVSVHVGAPVKEGKDRFALVIFDETTPARTPAPVPGRDVPERHNVADLEEELRQTREQLETTSAAHDRTVADLQMMNEELLSINVEQKTAGEELEVQREEIQSVNEELTTINQEHRTTIEELKRTNADLQNLIEATKIGTIFLDRALRIRRFTPMAAELFHLVVTDQGRPLGHIAHRLDYPELPRDLSQVLSTLESIEREVVSDVGSAYILRIHPYRSLEGEADGLVLTFFDNTARHRIENELREAKTVADAANRAKGTFLATLSHEFRTPLNAILGYAELLPLDGALSAAQETKVGRIKAATWHLAAMIDEILGFAKLDGGQEVADRGRLDAREIARQAADILEPAAAAKGLSFVLDVPEEPVRVETDGGKARQVLINLCGNAVTYTDSGEVRLTVRDGGGRVDFEVRDTGIGIAAEHKALIFDRFWRVDSAPTRLAGGLGIGLAAAREYGRLLGGDIEVESQLGAGSTFRFWLPAVSGGAAAEEEEPR